MRRIAAKRAQLAVTTGKLTSVPTISPGPAQTRLAPRIQQHLVVTRDQYLAESFGKNLRQRGFFRSYTHRNLANVTFTEYDLYAYGNQCMPRG